MEYDRTKNKRPLVGLSPMAGYTDSAFRGICRELGADFVVTELVSADGVIQSWKSGNTLAKSFELMGFEAEERPVFVQLFGGDPTKLKEASRIVANEMQPDGIDINMGCPAHKIVCNGYGCALLKNPALAAQVVRAASKGSNLSVTVKTRIGWSDDSLIDQFATAVAEAGASMLALHGRTYEQGFAGDANWDPIYRVKNSISIPVFGNGDIRSGEDALNKLHNLDGVLIGRAAVGNPWIFAEVQHALHTGQATAFEMSWDVRLRLLRHHARTKFEQKGERGLVEMRKFIPAYTKGLPYSSELRLFSNSICSLENIEEFIDRLRAIMNKDELANKTLSLA